MATVSSFPLWLAFGSAILWGLWWIPVKILESFGIAGIWTGTLMNVGALPVLLLLAFFAKNRPTFSMHALASGGLLGCAMVLYSAAITETTVVRSVLLFYLAPAWAIAIECLFMGRKFRALNALAFALAALGVATIFRGEISLSGWSIGDFMAVIAGIAWAVGSALIFTGPAIGARNLALYGCSGAIILGLIIAALSGTPLVLPHDPADTGLVALLTGTLYVTPVTIATLWSARRLAPTILSFLLTGEIISGVATSAWFLAEPFGWPEVIGSALIVGAALLEVISPNAPKPQNAV